MHLNLLSFLLSLCWLIVFFITINSTQFTLFFVSYFHVDPLIFLLVVTIITFFLANYGLKNVNNLTTIVRGLLTIVITLILLVIICITMFIRIF